MNDGELLERVKRDYPGPICLVLSGGAEPELAMRCAGTAHQCLGKLMPATSFLE